MKGAADAGIVEENTNRAMIGGMSAATLAGIGGLVFAIINIIDGTQEWWFDGGFYGSFIGGLVILFLGKKIIERINPDSKKGLLGNLF